MLTRCEPVPFTIVNRSAGTWESSSKSHGSSRSDGSGRVRSGITTATRSVAFTISRRGRAPIGARTASRKAAPLVREARDEARLDARSRSSPGSRRRAPPARTAGAPSSGQSYHGTGSTADMTRAGAAPRAAIESPHHGDPRAPRRHGPLRLSPREAERVAPGRSSGPRVVATQHWHFVEVEREPSAEERRTLDRLLHYGPEAPPPGQLGGRMILVTPRPGTISPWSSKATDIARQCGLDGLVRRIERGTAFHLDGDPGDLAAALPLLHDRMTEAVLASLDEADLLFRHVAPKPLAEIDVLARGRAAVEEANAAMGLALAPDEVDYLLAYFEGQRRNPTDVELTMFAQANSEHCRHKIFNASWVVDRQPHAAVALPDDPGDGEGEPRRNGQRLLGQRRGDGGPHRPALHGRPRHGTLPLPRRPDPHAHEGRDPQPPDRDLALPRRRHRLGRRDPRRGRDRPRLEAEGGPVRLLGLEPAPPRARAAVGRAGVAPRPHRLARSRS